jgi:hypothetical protein
MRIPVELPIWRSTVDPSSANNPSSSGDRREAPLSASQPQIGEKARSAAPYMAIKTDTQYCTRSCSTWLRLCRANGITGTITPYKNISYDKEVRISDHGLKLYKTIQLHFGHTHSKYSQSNSSNDKTIRASELQHGRWLFTMLCQDYQPLWSCHDLGPVSHDDCSIAVWLLEMAL